MIVLSVGLKPSLNTGDEASNDNNNYLTINGSKVEKSEIGMEIMHVSLGETVWETTSMDEQTCEMSVQDKLNVRQRCTYSK